MSNIARSTRSKAAASAKPPLPLTEKEAAVLRGAVERLIGGADSERRGSREKKPKR